MTFEPLTIPGAYRIEITPIHDDRGFFARTWCEVEFTKRGLNPRVVQCNISRNPVVGTLRGMHYQLPPNAEAKLVRCTAGRVFDVLVDLRPESPTFRRWEGWELSADNHRMLYIPEGCAHGYLTLEPDSEVAYQVSAPYAPDLARGVRYDDPAFGIVWPAPVTVIHPRDRDYADFTA